MEGCTSIVRELVGRANDVEPHRLGTEKCGWGVVAGNAGDEEAAGGSRRGLFALEGQEDGGLGQKLS